VISIPQTLRKKGDEKKKHIVQVAQILKKGGIIAYPTDTVYGIGTNVFDAKAVQRVYYIKQRPLHLPLSLAVSGKTMAQNIAVLNQRAQQLISKFWPGALTILVKKKPVIPQIVTSGTDLVGLRAPAHVVPMSIIKQSQIPIISTSANKHGKPPCINVECIRRNFGDQIDVIVEGEQKESIPSTVINVTTDPPLIVRQGPITKSMIEQALHTRTLIGIRSS
jgi:L-threonylcarbamoyladenylate synthase